MQGAMSQRFPMELSVDGKTLKGFFTKKSVLDYKKDYETAIKRAKGKVPGDHNAKLALDNLLPAFRAYMNEKSGDIRMMYPLTGDDKEYMLVLGGYLAYAGVKDPSLSEVELQKILLGYAKPQPDDLYSFTFGGPITGDLSYDTKTPPGADGAGGAFYLP